MKGNKLENRRLRQVVSILLVFALTLGYAPLEFLSVFKPIFISAQEKFSNENFKVSGEVTPVTGRPLYGGWGQLFLDSDGFVWGNTAYTGARGADNSVPSNGTPLNRVRGIDKPIRLIDAGQDGFNIGVSTDNKTLYTFGSSGYINLGGAATRINSNVYSYDFFAKHGVTIVDATATAWSGYVVDSNGDIWTFGYAWDGRGGSGLTPNKITNFNFGPTSDGVRSGKFTMIDAPEWFGAQDPIVSATTDEGELFVWGYNLRPNWIITNTGVNFNTAFGTKDYNGKAYALGQPIEVGLGADLSAEVASIGKNPYKMISSGRGTFLITTTGKMYYYGNAGNSGGYPHGLGSANNGKFITEPTRITKIFEAGDVGANESNAISALDVKFIDVDTAYGSSTALDSDGNVYHVGENWRVSSSNSADNYYYFRRITPRTSVRYDTSAPLISSKGKVIDITMSRQAINMTLDTGLSYTVGNEGGQYDATWNGTGKGDYNSTDASESGKIDFIQEGLLFTGVKGSGNVTKDITSTPGSSVLDKNNRLYSETGVDQTGVAPSLKFVVTMSPDYKKSNVNNTSRYDVMALTMHDTSAGGHNSSMRYVVVQPTNSGTYGAGDSAKTYHTLAVESLHKSMLPSFLLDKGVDVTNEISVDMFEQMYADGSITEKGNMTKISGNNATTPTEWETSGNVSGNSIVIALAKTTRNGFDYYSTMAFPVDNYYKQTKSYYNGKANTNAYAGTINIFGNKVIPGQYGVFVDSNNNPITDKVDDGSGTMIDKYQPPNGIDSTPDLSTYAGPSANPVAAGYYLTSPTISAKLKYWTPNSTKTQTLSLDPTKEGTPYEVLAGTKVDVRNTLTYMYEKNSNWQPAEVSYGYFDGSNWIDIADNQFEGIHGGIGIDINGPVLQPGTNDKFWPSGATNYSDGGDVFTPAPLSDAGKSLELTLVGYKVGSAPTSEFDYTKSNFSYDPLTGEFDFNPIVSSTDTNLYLVYKTNTVSLYEKYLNGDNYVKDLLNPADWNYNLNSSPITPAMQKEVLTRIPSTSGQALMTSGQAITVDSISYEPSFAGIQVLQGSTSGNEFFEIDRIAGGNGLDSSGAKDPAYEYNMYFERQANTSNTGSIAEYKKPITQINGQVLVGYFDEKGVMHNFWDPTTMKFVVPNKITTADAISVKTYINLIYLTDENLNGIPDVMEGSVEEKWVAQTASGSNVLMHRKFTTGYKTLETYTSREENFEPGEQWIYKSTDTATNGVKDTNSDSSDKIVTPLQFIDDQVNDPDSTPAYSKGKYTYAGTTGFRTVTYYYNEDSNVNGVIDILEPITITVKGITEQGKPLYSWPIESGIAEKSFDVTAMQVPTYTPIEIRLNSAAEVAVDITAGVTNQAVVVPSSVPSGEEATEADRNLEITFVYKETIGTLTVKQFDLAGNSIGEYTVPVDYTKPYNTVVPAVKGYTFDENKTVDPLNRYDDITGDLTGAEYTDIQKATIPTYNSGKIQFNNLAENNTPNTNVVHIYYAKDNGNITLYAVDIDTLGTPIIIGSTNSRKIASGDTFDPTDEANFPKDFEIPAISNYELKEISTTNPFNPSFDIEGKNEALSQTFGATPLKDVYYFYSRKNAMVLSQAFEVDSDGNIVEAILDENNAAIAHVYDSEVGQTEIVMAPADKELRHYVLVGYIDAQGNKIMGGASTSVYILNDEQRTAIKFLYRPLEPKEVSNISYVDVDNSGEYDNSDYIISERILNMLEDEVIAVHAPDILSYKFEGSYAYAEDGTTLTIPKTSSATIDVDSSRDKKVYFRYSTITSDITIKATATHGPDGVNVDISSLIPEDSKVVKASTGLEYIAYAPHIEGYYLIDNPSKNIGVVTGDMETSPFMYAPLEDIAADYMAKVTIRGLNIADDSPLYEYEVYASKGKDFTAKSINLPSYKVLKADNITESDETVVKTINISYTDDKKVVDFYYKSQEVKATAYYWDEVNNEFFEPSKEIQGAIFGSPITEYADYFEGYYYSGYSNTKPTTTSTPTDSNPLGTINSVDLNNNAIYFYYKPFTTENIRVYYIEDDGNFDGTLSSAKIFSTSSDMVSAINGTEKIVTAKDFTSTGYTSPVVMTQTVTFVTGQPSYDVFFVYKKDLANVVIKGEFYEADGVTLIETRDIKTLEDQRVQEAITVEPPFSSGFYTDDIAKNIIVGGSGSSVTFKYIKLPQQSVTVVAKENDTNGQVLSSYTITADIDAPVYLKPTKLIGWKLINTTDETVNKTHLISKDAETIEYYYEADVETVNIELYSKSKDGTLTDIKDKLPGVKTSFTTPKSNSDLGYTLGYRVYAPNMPKYVLVDASKYYHDFTETNKGTTYRFVYQSIDDIAVEHMAKVVVRGEYTDRLGTANELYSYAMYVPLNDKTEIEYIELEGYKLIDGENEIREINPVRNGETGTVDAGIVEFLYESTAGEVTIIEWNDDTNTQISKTVKRDSTIGQQYSAVSKGIPGKYYIGYSIGTDENGPGSSPTIYKKSVADINPIDASGHFVYFHYMEIRDGVFARYWEITDSGPREITTVLVGMPTVGTYTVTAEGDYSSWTNGSDLKDVLKSDYYDLVSDNPSYPVDQEVTIINPTADIQYVDYLYKKQTRTFKVQLVDGSGNPIDEDGSSYNIELRVGEYSTVLGPDSVNYISSPRRKGVFITDDNYPTNTINFTAKIRTSYTTTINFINKDEVDNNKKIFSSYTMNVLQGQQVSIEPKNQIGWTLTSSPETIVDSTITTGTTANFEGGKISTINFEYVPNVQKFNVSYQYNGSDIATAETFETPRYDSIFNMSQYSDIALYAKNIPGYVLVANEQPVKSYSVNDHTSDDSAINVVFKYIKITEVLDEYTVKVNVKGIGRDSASGGEKTLYEYTLTYPELSEVNSLIKTQTVPDRYFFTNSVVTGGSLDENTDYLKNALTYEITLVRTKDSNNGDINITFNYDYVPLGYGTITILAVSEGENNKELSRNTFTANLGTKLVGASPTIKGYTLTNTNETSKEGTVSADPTDIIFYFTPDPTGNATVNFVAGDVIVKTDTITDIVASETTKYLLPDTFVYNNRIYNLSSSQSKTLYVEGNTAPYNANYVDAGPAYVEIPGETIYVPGEKVYVDGGTEYITEIVEKVVEKIVYVDRDDYDRDEYLPVVNDKLYKVDTVPYVSGYPDETFKPDNSVTRAEVAVMFYNLSTDSTKNNNQNSTFTDVKADDWYSQAINYLAKEGVLNGYGNGEFRPNDTITRAEFAAITSRFDALVTGANANFTDVTKEHWANDAINSGYARGWINGYPNGEFRPNGKITRAETVKIINCMIDRSGKTEYTQADNKFSDVRPSHWAFQDIIESSIKYAIH